MKHTRSSVLKRAVAEYEALDAIVKRLRPADFGRHVFDERAPAQWTVKDVIAHLTAWKLRDVRRISRDRSPLKAYDAPYDDLANRLIYERSHRTPAKTIGALAAQAVGATVWSDRGRTRRVRSGGNLSGRRDSSTRKW